jgi:hypothetical protein
MPQGIAVRGQLSGARGRNQADDIKSLFALDSLCGHVAPKVRTVCSDRETGHLSGMPTQVSLNPPASLIAF